LIVKPASQTTVIPNGQCALPTILFFDHTASLGGGEIALLNLVQGLDRARFRPLVVLGEAGALSQKLEDAGVETRVVPIAREVAQMRKDALGAGSLLRLRAMAQSMAYAWRLARLIRCENAALVHTNSLKADIIGGVAARLARVPLVWHVRDRIEADYLPRPIVRLFRMLCAVLPDHVIANSQATLQTLHLPARRFPATIYSGVNHSRSSVVHDGVEVLPVFFPPTPAGVSPVIGIIGRISPWKGQHIFIQMAAAVHARCPGARFQICGAALFGEAAYEADLRAQVRQAGLEDCLEFLGFRSDVVTVVQNLDLLVHASTTGEPFGQVIIEGMAACKPVVATRGGGVPEIVEDGVTGSLVPMNDAPAMTQAVLDILADPKAAQAMGMAGYQRVQDHFTMERAVRQVETIYTEMLTRRGHPPVFASPSSPPQDAETGHAAVV
jgi:glycosyltransferase involved in cell wall biosynthesis